MAPRRTAEQRRAEENRRRRNGHIPNAYQMGLQRLLEEDAAILSRRRVPERRAHPEPHTEQEPAAARLTHAVYEAHLSLQVQNREERAARIRVEEQAARSHEEARAAARQRVQQRAAAAAAEESLAMVRNIEAGDTGIPRQIEHDMSWWAQDTLTYIDYAVPVYTLVPVTREDMCLFIRDDLATNELASRTISLPGQWDWSNGRGNLSDIVEHHVHACLDRLKELDDENDNEDQQRIAWARNPVVCTTLDH